MIWSSCWYRSCNNRVVLSQQWISDSVKLFVHVVQPPVFFYQNSESVVLTIIWCTFCGYDYVILPELRFSTTLSWIMMTLTTFQVLCFNYILFKMTFLPSCTNYSVIVCVWNTIKIIIINNAKSLLLLQFPPPFLVFHLFSLYVLQNCTTSFLSPYSLSLFMSKRSSLLALTATLICGYPNSLLIQLLILFTDKS